MKKVEVLITQIKIDLSKEFDFVRSSIKDNEVVFTSGENNFFLTSIKLDTLKDSVRTGEYPQSIKKLLR